jgi:site-specific recombinase XerC
MRNTPTRTQEPDRLQRLADTNLDRAVAQGIAEAHRLRAQAFREAFHQAGLGLSEIFGLGHRRLAPRVHRGLSRG